ncbi:hypothetical protein [Streptomyces sp. NPDC088246]|uniref:hypothetical protein n=1 Tax=Streptomyces sp. NPDC088246 TaxID=3365842 RepID=UPI0037FB33E4
MARTEAACLGRGRQRDHPGHQADHCPRRRPRGTAELVLAGRGIWLRNPNVVRLLRGLAIGTIPLTHDE